MTQHYATVMSPAGGGGATLEDEGLGRGGGEGGEVGGVVWERMRGRVRREGEAMKKGERLKGRREAGFLGGKWEGGSGVERERRGEGGG